MTVSCIICPLPSAKACCAHLPCSTVHRLAWGCMSIVKMPMEGGCFKLRCLIGYEPSAEAIKMCVAGYIGCWACAVLTGSLAPMRCAYRFTGTHAERCAQPKGR